MNAKMTTRQQLKNPRQKTIEKKVSASHNTSYLSVQVEYDDDDNKNTPKNIILDLRNKLATELANSEKLAGKLKHCEEKILDLTKELKYKNDTIQDLKETIEKFAQNKILTNSATQTTTTITKESGIQTVKCLNDKVDAQKQTTNEFEMCQNHSHLNPHKATNKHQKKNQILILADDHGRDLAKNLHKLLPTEKFSIQVIFKPNAKFEDVVSNCKKLTSTYTKNDYVIVIAGSNNALTNGFIKIHTIKKVISDLANTNIIMSTIPYCNGRLVLNRIIGSINENIFREVKCAQHTSTKVLDINKYITNSHIKQHTNQMNWNGKRYLSESIKNIILLYNDQTIIQKICYNTTESTHINTKNINAKKIDQQSQTETWQQTSLKLEIPANVNISQPTEALPSSPEKHINCEIVETVSTKQIAKKSKQNFRRTASLEYSASST